MVCAARWREGRAVLRRVLAGLVLMVTGGVRLIAEEPDVLIYGATPAGIAAAISAAKAECRVLLVEPTARIGGLATSGLSHSDFHSFESLSGAFLDFARRVEAYYVKTYGPDSAQVRDSFRGTFGEPKVNLAILEQMLAEHGAVTVRKEYRLGELAVSRREGAVAQIEAAAFTTTDGAPLLVRAKVFIDATYEGDLMAQAGVTWRVGREGRAEFDEPLAPEQPDGQLQAYNFRFIMTRDPANRVTPVAPPGYPPEDFAGMRIALASGRIKKIFDYPRDCVFKAQTPPLPNGKFDINDVSGGHVRLSLPGRNLAWPDGDAAARAAVFAEHLRDQVGLLYFLQNDPTVPTKFQREAREWGWCRDEFVETGHLPPQLYVREARRMAGVHIFTQKDSEHAPGDARAVLHRDAIAMGDYGNNCHGTSHDGPRFGGKHAGEFYHPVPPYQIPYGVMLPREVHNLLVPGAVSSSHVGFCALRYEPIWMSLGQAAGHAAAMAVKGNVPVQHVPVPALQQRLQAEGAATIYTSDVLPGAPLFAAVQWWGTLGGLHGLEPMPEKPGQRGKNIHGQYFEANPGHEVGLAVVLEPELAERWGKLAYAAGVRTKLPEANGRTTRGEFIAAVFAARAGPR